MKRKRKWKGAIPLADTMQLLVDAFGIVYHLDAVLFVFTGDVPKEDGRTNWAATSETFPEAVARMILYNQGDEPGEAIPTFTEEQLRDIAGTIKEELPGLQFCMILHQGPTVRGYLSNIVRSDAMRALSGFVTRAQVEEPEPIVSL